MEDFIRKSQFSGGYEEDLDNCFQVFYRLTSTGQVSDGKMEGSSENVLNGDALSFFQANPTNVRHTTMPYYYYKIGIITMKNGVEYLRNVNRCPYASQCYLTRTNQRTSILGGLQVD